MQPLPSGSHAYSYPVANPHCYPVPCVPLPRNHFLPVYSARLRVTWVWWESLVARASSSVRPAGLRPQVDGAGRNPEKHKRGKQNVSKITSDTARTARLTLCFI